MWVGVGRWENCELRALHAAAPRTAGAAGRPRVPPAPTHRPRVSGPASACHPRRTPWLGDPGWLQRSPRRWWRWWHRRPSAPTLVAWTWGRRWEQKPRPARRHARVVYVHACVRVCVCACVRVCVAGQVSRSGGEGRGCASDTRWRTNDAHTRDCCPATQQTHSQQFLQRGGGGQERNSRLQTGRWPRRRIAATPPSATAAHGGTPPPAGPRTLPP